MRLRNLTQCLTQKLEDLKESGAVGTETRAGRSGQSIMGLLPFPGDRERLSGDKKMPPPGKVNSLVMLVVFFKPKFVTCGLRRRLEHNG